jgi:hypothetical protein
MYRLQSGGSVRLRRSATETPTESEGKERVRRSVPEGMKM